MSSNDNISVCGYTVDLKMAAIEEAKAVIAKNLELLRPHIEDLDTGENVLSADLGIDEFGFDEDGRDRLYEALVEGYLAAKEERGLLASYPVREDKDQERWFCVAGGENYAYEPFEGWSELWVLMSAVNYAPQLREIGVYGLGIVSL